VLEIKQPQGAITSGATVKRSRFKNVLAKMRPAKEPGAPVECLRELPGDTTSFTKEIQADVCCGRRRKKEVLGSSYTYIKKYIEYHHLFHELCLDGECF